MNITEWIEKNWQLSEDLQWKIFLSMVLIFSLYAIRVFAINIIFKKTLDPKDRYTWKNGIKNTYYVLLILALGAVWVDRIGSLATFLGLVTAGLAIALQDPIVNLAGWFFLIVRKPFKIGDRIEIGGVAGDVIDVRFFQFTINEINNWVDADQSTGRIIHIPNGRIFKEPQANFTQGFLYIWNEMSVLVTFESNWTKAKEILETIVNRHAESLSKQAERKLLEASEKFMIFYTSLTPIVYTSVEDSGVKLTLRYLVNPRKRRGTEHVIWEDILKSFAREDDVDFAYPTQRIYYNLKEGKSGAKASE